jgi:glutaredoxin
MRRERVFRATRCGARDLAPGIDGPRVRYDNLVVKKFKTALDCRKRSPLPCADFAPAYVPTMTIKAYLKPQCGWSNGVRAILRKYNLAYEDIDIINNRASYAEMVQKSGQPLSPCVDVDGVMLADVSGEEVENYLLSNDLVKPTDVPLDVATNAGCSDTEHAKMATKTIRFF